MRDRTEQVKPKIFNDFLAMKATDSLFTSASVKASSGGCGAGSGPISSTSNLGSDQRKGTFLMLKRLFSMNFIEANATSTFRSIISSYQGDLILISIQCPNLDFNKPEHRWSMLQKSLIKAMEDLLSSKGKVSEVVNPTWEYLQETTLNKKKCKRQLGSKSFVLKELYLRFKDVDDNLKRVEFSSKKLIDLGFEFKYSLEDMFRGAVKTCREKGLLPLSNEKKVSIN
ncbi:hypothetical protein PTKIN_Ptkin02bG0105700 [Pterospermum kingtungense]